MDAAYRLDGMIPSLSFLRRATVSTQARGGTMRRREAREATPILFHPKGLAGALAALCMIVASAAALAQSDECGRLYAAIQAADNAGRDGGDWGRAAAQQRAEIERTQRYADQLGCENGGGLFGDDAPAPQCSAVLDRLQRMQDNLDTIQTQARQARSDSSDHRSDLVARYNAMCVGSSGNPADLSQRGGVGALLDEFGNAIERANPFNTDNLSAVPLNGDIMDGNDGGGGAVHGQAICVRTCDGGYFPLASRARDDQLDQLQQLCQASCPNTEAKLYTMAHPDELAGATAVDGSTYTALPAAFKFEKSFEPTCTCKPPGKSWTEALADAEKLLGDQNRHDITVTAAMSDQMARPGAVPVTKGKTAKSSKGAKSAATPVPDARSAREGQTAAQAPTASNETTGIANPVQPERIVRAGDGPTASVPGPNGTSRRIRVIVP